MPPIFGDCLEDPCRLVEQEDVGALIEGERSAWDAILLDVDNGLDGLTRPGNDRLYSATGLDATRSALRAGDLVGCVRRKFVRRSEMAGFAVDEVG